MRPRPVAASVGVRVSVMGSSSAVVRWLSNSIKPGKPAGSDRGQRARGRPARGHSEIRPSVQWRRRIERVPCFLMASESRTDPLAAATTAPAPPAKPVVDGRAPSERMPVDRVVHPDQHAPIVRADLTETERRLLGDLFAIVEGHSEDAAVAIERPRVEDAFLFACEHHADQRRKSGEDFIVHPVGVAKICAGMRLDTETLCAALLHDTVEDTSASLDEDREEYVQRSGSELTRELDALGIHAEIAGRAKHFYSIYSKMTKKGREFNEIYDLTAMRVIVDSVKDCYGAVGVIHSLWKPLPGRFKDFIAMPKFNMYQSLHTTVIGPEGLPLEIQIRTREMHDMAEFGVAAHWIYKEGARGKPVPQGEQKLKWLRSMLDWQQELQDPKEFMENLKVDLFDEEVFVFTPKGEVKSLASGATPLDFAYEIHTELGHRCVGAKVNSKIVPLNYQLKSGDIVEVLTSKRERGPSRDWLAVVKTTRARNKIKQWFKQESRQDTEHSGRALLQEAFNKAGLPPQKIAGSPLLADVIREMGFRKAEDFYVALGGAKITPKVVVNKVMQRLKQGEAAEAEQEPVEALVSPRRERRQPTGSSGSYGIRVEGVDDVMLRLAKCCRPVPGDPIVGYGSLGRGITIHRDDCPNTAALRKDPERFTPVAWDGDPETSFRVEIEVDGWDRHRLLEDMSRTFAEAGINILEARCVVTHPMVKNRFVVEVGDTRTLDQTINRLRNIDSVFDAYRVTPGAG